MTATDNHWRTFEVERRVLVVARTTTALNRLLDVASLLATDHRIQLVFTHDPDNTPALGSTAHQFLRDLDVLVLDWDLAVQERFDLALSASENDHLDRLDAPVLLLPHGAGFGKHYPNTRVVSGMDPTRLVRGERVIPAAIALSHPEQQLLLQQACPAAADRGVVIGDPCLDRMLVSGHRVDSYRARLSAVNTTLVLVASTYGPDSLVGSRPEILDDLIVSLPVDEYRIVAVLHPGVWSAHGPWQIRAWLSRAREAGVVLIPPEQGWQAALLAADVVLSDHGSLGVYAAALDKPLLLGGSTGSLTSTPPTTVEGSAAAALAGRAQRLDVRVGLREQIDTVSRNHVPGSYEGIARAVGWEPGHGAARLSGLLYGLLNLSEPAQPPQFPPYALPTATPRPAAALVCGVDGSGPAPLLTRFPDLGTRMVHDTLHYRHLLVDVDAATLGQVGAATILTTEAPRSAASWNTKADRLLRQWPGAVIVAAVGNDGECLIRTRQLSASMRARGPGEEVDPLALACLAYVRLCQTDGLRQFDSVQIGLSIIDVVLADCSASPSTG